MRLLTETGNPTPDTFREMTWEIALLENDTFPVAGSGLREVRKGPTFLVHERLRNRPRLKARGVFAVLGIGEPTDPARRPGLTTKQLCGLQQVFLLPKYQGFCSLQEC